MEERFKTFTVLVAKLSRNIRKIKAEEMAEMNLKSPHVSCLYYLYKEGPMTAKELCDMCEEDKAAISRSIVCLEREGYLVCDTPSAKRYKSPLELTDKGMEAGSRIAEKVDSVITAASKGLSDEDRYVFYRSLALISENLQDICDNYRKTKYSKEDQ